MVETAMIGRDGIVGGSNAFGSQMAVNKAVVQLGGMGSACDVNAFRDIVRRSPSLAGLLTRYEQTLLGQAQQSAACLSTHDVEARLCRWLLRAQDLTGRDELPFTQEFLAEMLGAQRTSVSLTAHTLQRAGVIRYSRGRVQILRRDALEEGACKCYGTVRSQYDLLMGNTATETLPLR